MRERTKEFHLCVVVKTERRFRRTHVGSEKKTKRSERRFEIIRSFGDFSRSGRARLSFCSTTREQQREQQQSEKKRETFERKARGFKRDQSHLQISFAASFCVFLAGVSRRSRRFFCSKFEKKTLEAKKEERKKEKKKYRLIREERQHRDNRAAAKVAAFVSRIIFVSRIRRL